MNDIAVVKIIKVQQEFSTAAIASKKTGSLSLIRKGDKIFPVDKTEMQAMIDNKVFSTTRPRSSNIDDELQRLRGK